MAPCTDLVLASVPLLLPVASRPTLLIILLSILTNIWPLSWIMPLYASKFCQANNQSHAFSARAEAALPRPRLFTRPGNSSVSARRSGRTRLLPYPFDRHL